MGLSSSFLLNDTIAIIGTPVVLLLAQDNKMSSKPLLLALAFAVTIGSVMSPIGNPQNLLVAINGSLNNPFIDFFRYLFVPTVVNLFLAFILLKLFYKKQFCGNFSYEERPIKDARLAFLSKISLILVFVLVAAKIVIVFLGVPFDFKLTYIALLSAVPLLVFSPKRFSLIQKIDWHTLLFFATMFILMASVWNTGFFQSIINSLAINLVSIPAVFSISVLLSQLISNVPFVALYLPLLIQGGAATKELMALAAGSTIAGNFSILGAASNVIIIQNAEKKANQTLSFIEFAKVGIPLTLLNVLVYWVFLVLL
jgi:Na+/H+ antiporter NhaD/arsenite permease-like protein